MRTHRKTPRKVPVAFAALLLLAGGAVTRADEVAPRPAASLADPAMRQGPC